MTAPRTWVIRLPWTKPPLSLNDRGHWRSKARKTADVRRLVWIAVQQENVPAVHHVVVELVYVPRDSRRRDADNVVATLKAAADALVDAGVVQDDTPQWMTKHMPVIAPPDGDPRLELRIREVPP